MLSINFELNNTLEEELGGNITKFKSMYISMHFMTNRM